MADGCGDDITTPTILDSHGHTQRGAEVTRLAGFGEPAKLADLDVDDIHGTVGVAAEQNIDRIDVFIEHERVITVLAHGEALFVGSAGLFDINIDIAHSLHHTQGIVHEPACVGISHQAVAGLELGCHRVNAGNIGGGITADFQLEAAITLGAVVGHLGGHLVWRFLGDGAVEDKIIAIAAAE